MKWGLATLVFAAFFVGFIVLFVSAYENATPQEAAGGEQTTLPDTPVDAAAAEAIYKNSCMGCHGADLEGGAGPNLQKVGASMSAEQMFKLIQNGKGIMPGFKSQLQEDEIANLAKWLAEFK